MAGSDPTGMNTERNRKRSRQLFDSIMDVVQRNIDQLPAPKPKRHLDEAHLRAIYLAEKSQAQQAPPLRTNRIFSTPNKWPAKQPSFFSPATSKLYASPVAKPMDSPARQPASAHAQQPSGFGAAFRQSTRFTPVHARPHQPTLGSRLGPSCMQPQASPSSYPMHFLDSAPATTPVQSAAAATSSAGPSADQGPFATPVNVLLPDGYYATTPANGTPYGVTNLDQPEQADRNVADGMLASSRGRGLFAEAGAGVSQQSPAAPQQALAYNGVALQSNVEDRSRASVLKRLVAKRQAMAASGLPAQGFSPSLTSTPHSARGRGIKRTAADVSGQDLDGPSASRQRMEAALKAIPQAEKAAEEEAAAAKAAAQGPAPPPTALLGFGPASQTSAQSQSAKGKHSWPANFFQQAAQQQDTLAVATASSGQGSGSSGQHESGGSGVVVDQLENGHAEEQGQDGGVQHEAAEQHDYGAAWREAAESPSPGVTTETGVEPQVTSPPFSMPVPRQTPVPPPTASLFTSAPSPATVPAKLFTSAAKSRTAVQGDKAHSPVSSLPMFSSKAGQSSSLFASPAKQQDSSDSASVAKQTGAAKQVTVAEQAGGHKAAKSSPAPAASGWGAALLQGNKAAAGQAAEAAADVRKAEANMATLAAPAPAASSWGATLLQSKASAGQAAGQEGVSAPTFKIGVTPAAESQAGAPSISPAEDSQANAAQQEKGKSTEGSAGQAAPDAAKQTPPAGASWGAAVSQAAAAQDTQAAAKEASQPTGQSASTALASKFSFGVPASGMPPPAATQPAWPAFVVPTAPAAAPKFSFGVPAGGMPPPATAQRAWPAFVVPSASGSNAEAAQEQPDSKGDKGAAGEAVQATADDATQARKAAPAASGWGAAFVLDSQAAVTQPQDSAATEANQQAGHSVPPASPLKISFGLPSATSQAASPPIAIPKASGSNADAAQDGNDSLARDGSFMSISPQSFSARKHASSDPFFGPDTSAAAAAPIPGGFSSFTGFETSSQLAQSDTTQAASTPAVGSSVSGSAPSAPLGQQSSLFPPATFGSSTGSDQQAQAGVGQQAQAVFGQAQPSFAFGQQAQAASSAPFGQQPPASFTFGQLSAPAVQGSDQQPQTNLPQFGQQFAPAAQGSDQQPQVNLPQFGQQSQGISGGFSWQAPASQQAGPTMHFSFGQAAAGGTSQTEGNAPLQFGQAAALAQQPAQAQGMPSGAGPAAAPPTFGSGAFGQITSAFPAVGAASGFNIGAGDPLPKPASSRRKLVAKRRHR